MRTLIICLCLLSGCAGDKTSSETNVVCTTNVAQYVKNQETPIENIADNLAEGLEVTAVEQIETPEGVQELVTVSTVEIVASVEQCNNNGGVSDNDVTLIGNEQ